MMVSAAGAAAIPKLRPKIKSVSAVVVMKRLSRDLGGGSSEEGLSCIEAADVSVAEVDWNLFLFPTLPVALINFSRGI